MPLDISEKAKKLHSESIVIDGHCDSVLIATGIGPNDQPIKACDLLSRNDYSHIDVPRLIEGGVTTQLFAMFTPDQFLPEVTSFTDKLLDKMDETISRSNNFVHITKASQIVEAKEKKHVGAMFTIEGGEAIGQSLDLLKHFYDRGVRLMTLTWNRQNAIGRGAKCPGPDGITPFGKNVISKMEEIGMIVDVSHLCDQALEEVLEIAHRPLVASHSNSRVLCGHNRNLKDDQAERIAKTGGVIGVTFAGVFVDEQPAKVTVSKLLDHIDHLVSVVGEDHVGLGTDFDGFTAPYGLLMKDCSEMPLLTQGLLDRNYSEQSIKKILGENWLRVIKEIC